MFDKTNDTSFSFQKGDRKLTGAQQSMDKILIRDMKNTKQYSSLILPVPWKVRKGYTVVTHEL